MASYNLSPEMSHLQKDAIARVNEMKQLTQGYLNSDHPANNPNNFSPPPDKPMPKPPRRDFSYTPPPPKEPQTNTNNTPPPPPNNNPLSGMGGSIQQLLNSFLGSGKSNTSSETNKESSGILGLGGLLKDFQIDEEKALIGLLIYIIYKNGGDFKLMLALGYLLL